MTTTDLSLAGFYADSVASGLTVTQDTLLDGNVAAGVAYISEAVITVLTDAKTFTASKDTYVDVGNDAVITYTETVIDAGAPALAADAIRLAKVVTDGTTITSIVDLRTVATEGHYTFGTVAIVGTTLRVYNPTNNPINIRYGSTSTSHGEPLAPFTAIDVDETVYARPNHAGAVLSITS